MDNTKAIISALKNLYPNANCALEHKNIFELLISTILSAQCTDERVNKTTPALFTKYPNAALMAKAPIEDLETLIKPTGFYHSKALSLKEASKRITDFFGGEIPKDKEKLMTLRGVAGKTANVVLCSGYGIASGIVVDTHVKRLSFRMGLTKETLPEKIEKNLIKKVPKADWIWFSHALIMHGRKVCNARKPLCATCTLKQLCPKKGLK